MKIKAFLLGCFLPAFALIPAYSQLQPVEKVVALPGETKISYEKYILENGLTVYIHEDHSDPIVHVEVTYKVGANREHAGITGFAHFFEHMMFQGSKHVADEEHIEIIESAGGQMNGTTNEDRTNYFETLPSNMLETALWLEADRMGWLLPAVTKEKFEIQRAAVKNEKEQNIVNQPYALAFSELYLPYLYPAGHPYSWPVIGYVEDLDRVTVDDLKKFFLRWYGPNNAVLVISGDVNPGETIKMVQKYFGSIPRGQEVKKLRTEAVSLDQDRFAIFFDNNASFPVSTFHFPTVPNYHRDEAALDVLAHLLGNGRNSLIYQRFVKSKFAIQADVSHPCRELAGEFNFQLVPHPRQFYGVDPGKVQTMLYDSIKSLIDSFDPMTVTDEDLRSVITTFEVSAINSLESVAGKAATITNWDRLGPKDPSGKPYNLDQEIDRYRKVTRSDLKRVFEKYIKNSGALVTLVYPAADPESKTVSIYTEPVKDEKAEKEYAGLSYTEPSSDFDRSKRPVPSTAVPSKVPGFEKATFDNGVKVIHTRTDELPKITMILRIGGGKLMEAYQPKLLGLSVITADMMEEGTLLRSSEQISAALEAIGSSISFSASGNATTVVLTSLTKNIDASLKILEEMLLKPAFRKEDLDRIKEQREQLLISSNKNPQAVALKAFHSLIYGDNILAANNGGYLNTISKITVNDVRDFYEKNYSPSVSTLTIVGNIDLEEMLPKLDFLKKWTGKEVKLPQVTNFPPRKQTAIYIVDKPGAPQSVIAYGKRAMPYSYNDTFYKIFLANYPLGGSFNSRININLREEKGYTYGASSFITGSAYPGYWTVMSSVRADATDSALTEIYKEIKNFYENGISETELATTKKSVFQSNALSYETSFEKAGFLNQVLLYDLPENYTSIQHDILNNITKTELDQLIKSFFNPEDMIIVVVGDAADIKNKLKATQLGKVIPIDPDKIKVVPAK